MKCEYCGNEHTGTFGSGRFCNYTCAHGFSTKAKRKEINKKVSIALTGKESKLKKRIIKKCLVCDKEFETTKSKNKICCSVECGRNNPEYRKKMSIIGKKRCKDINERIRLREIGRKGGFGKKGLTKNGTRYESNLEKQCFDYLEENNIKFESHKNIPNSSKVSDVYINRNNLWIEIDGINREKKKKWLKEDYVYWLEKLEIYKNNKLNYVIVTNFKEFKNILSR